MKTTTRHWAQTSLFSLALSVSGLAQADASTALSAASTIPVAVSVAAPVALIASGLVLSVVAVEASAQGTVWILERASDGARVSVHLAGQILKGAALAAGAAVTVSVIGAGTVLSIAGEAVCFIPNEIGAALLYNERVKK
ncbi:hypothetical protein RQP53_20795 [Paucibacter sp. APW11]|uniref:Uncharacterized protein n=1 Tax=Roseateles aquae TaxID=3077235 RepID=A0ABU3PGU2_9BURK|nr:hypothetical protein [Paucibacter sp. APW11]MDT9001728.1 hypothetical protein [Paucibacter sp. APW11]